MQAINFWPILVASLVAFGLGALWYSPILFGKEWMSLIKMDDSEIAGMKVSGVWKGYVTQFILTLVTFAILGFVINSTIATTATDGGFIGFILWLGFIIPTAASGLLWKKDPFKLVLIDVVNQLLVLVIGGAIIGAWR